MSIDGGLSLGEGNVNLATNIRPVGKRKEAFPAQIGKGKKATDRKKTSRCHRKDARNKLGGGRKTKQKSLVVKKKKAAEEAKKKSGPYSEGEKRRRRHKKEKCGIASAQGGKIKWKKRASFRGREKKKNLRRRKIGQGKKKKEMRSITRENSKIAA